MDASLAVAISKPTTGWDGLDGMQQAGGPSRTNNGERWSSMRESESIHGCERNLRGRDAKWIGVDASRTEHDTETDRRKATNGHVRMLHFWMAPFFGERGEKRQRGKERPFSILSPSLPSLSSEPGRQCGCESDADADGCGRRCESTPLLSRRCIFFLLLSWWLGCCADLVFDQSTINQSFNDRHLTFLPSPSVSLSLSVSNPIPSFATVAFAHQNLLHRRKQAPGYPTTSREKQQPSIKSAPSPEFLSLPSLPL